jgi:hypothetical protein
MAGELYGGPLDPLLPEFAGSMANAIEIELANLVGLPSGDPTTRRKLLVAISRGVIKHLSENQEAFVIKVTVQNHPTVTTHPDIKVKTQP